MRGLTLYLRSRRAPLALGVTAGIAVLMWLLAAANTRQRDVAPEMVVLSVLLMVAALTTTLVSPDYALDRTAALRWPPRRAAHLVAVLLIVVGVLAVTLATPARFGPVSLVARDAVGLLGLTALGASLTTPSRSWFLPLGWTLAAVLFSSPETVLGRTLTWQSQAPGDTAALVTALVLAFGGFAVHILAGPPRKAAVEPGA
ncbi:hypothetical protein [Actinoplanes teichomyceticus]|uniref:Fluoroquinolone transport system permease protein n=1 Tax=Actinoplanes teichomyceticus TaxID=1867 RepID=A0A561WQX1_ACTTI|nr:hypothetical protein [Actinoplanes teichomyceticus]TWG26257.1 hypothetical protein FHX34_1011238 [Actinoplanes teichomyceticus]GIF11336.1 hypothetical protein Ate01nite_13680 [Actinoplanes teichomyceticus]